MKQYSIDQELFEAARENNVPEVSQLLSDGADVNVRYNDDETALIEASYRGHVQVVKELLEYGADTEARDDDGSTALLFACCKGYLAVVIALLEHGADIDVLNRLYRTPLHWACSNDDLAVVNELLSPGAEFCGNDSNDTTTNCNILGKRKSRGADTESKDNGGETPLHLACLSGNPAIVKALLSGGADICAANNNGDLPIKRAVSGRNTETVKYLLQHSYATTCRLPLHELLKDLTWIGNPFPPLREALHQNVLSLDDVVEIIEYLVGRNPAMLSSRDQDGSLPLHVACRRGASFAIVQSLVTLYKVSVKCDISRRLASLPGLRDA
jgi:ankyrin repeat protein